MYFNRFAIKFIKLQVQFSSLCGQKYKNGLELLLLKMLAFYKYQSLE